MDFWVGATERHSAEAPSSLPQRSPAHFVVSGSCGKMIQKWDLAPNPGDPPPFLRSWLVLPAGLLLKT